MPRVTAIEKQSAGATCANLLNQGCEVCKPTHFAVLRSCFVKVQIRKRMCFARARLDAIVLEQGITDQVRGFTKLPTEAQVDVRLAEINGFELRVAVSKVHQVHIAELWEVIEVCCGLRSTQVRAQ